MYDNMLSKRKGKKCVIYIRVSSERQVKGYSLDGQKNYLTQWAEFEGMEVVEIYVEEGRSGKSIEGRNAFQTMLHDIEIGNISIDYIIVFKLSRFGRNAKDILNSLTFIQRFGVNLLCKEDGLDSSSSMGKMMITILGAVAEMERENIIAQSMLGREEKAKQGGWNGGFAPYGYELIDGKLIPKEGEAEIITLIFDKFVNGNMGYSTIAGYLNKQGIERLPAKNSHGRKYTDWDSNQVKRILDNPLYTGRMAYGRRRTEKVDGTENEYRLVNKDEYILTESRSHEPLVDDDTYKKAREKRKATGKKGNPKIGREAVHLLSGILKCPKCGSSMFIDKSIWTDKNGKRKEILYYVCGHSKKSKHGNCTRNSVRADVIEREVLYYTKKLIKNPRFVEDIQSRIGTSIDISEIEKELQYYKKNLEKLERSKNNLSVDIDNIVESDKHAERKRLDMNKRLNKIYDDIYDVEESIIECEAKMDNIQREKLDRDGIYKMLLAFDDIFDTLNEADKRNLIKSMVSKIDVFSAEEAKERKYVLKSITYAFPMDREIVKSLTENEPHVETVVMLSHKKPDSVINVKVEFGEGEGKVPLDNIAKRAEAYKPK
ncbi:recombinase family protein, partial [Lachnospiraceae bacterium]|nr:recombinase family protein [Lachnospiraceae bacterium]